MTSANKSGFTLLEILIAITIMAALTTFTASSISSSVRNSAKYRQQIDEMAELRSVTKVIEKDVNLAFNYRSVQIEVYNQIAKERGKSRLRNAGSAAPNDESSSAPPVLNRREVKNYTHFKGSDTALHFTSLSNTRTITDSKESDQAEISYYLASCTSRGNDQERSQCLWRRISPEIDDNIEEGGDATPILEKIRTFKLRYLPEISGKEEPQWLDNWDSKSARDQRSQEKFPAAVEIQIEVERPRGEKTITQQLTTIAALRFPNNPETPSEGPQPTGNSEEEESEEEPEASPAPEE